MSDQDSRDSRVLVPPAEILDEPAPDREIPEKDPETGEVVGFRKLKSLSLREYMFVQEYLKDFDVAKVAERMAMSPRKVHGFLQRKHVKAEVMKRAEAQFKANDMDTTWVMANIREVVKSEANSDQPSHKL